MSDLAARVPENLLHPIAFALALGAAHFDEQVVGVDHHNVLRSRRRLVSHTTHLPIEWKRRNRLYEKA